MTALTTTADLGRTKNASAVANGVLEYARSRAEEAVSKASSVPFQLWGVTEGQSHLETCSRVTATLTWRDYFEMMSASTVVPKS